MRRDENGYIVVETVGSFILFVFLMISILTLVNIVTLQARVHSAITQAANTMSKYSYVQVIADNAGASDNINQVIYYLTQIGEVTSGAGIPINPESMIGMVINDGVDVTLARLLVERYLRNGDMCGDDYLHSVNVIGGIHGLDFTVSTEDERIKIVVDYRVAYRFGALPLPFPELRITQTAMTRAWLGGSGEGYKR